MNEFNENRELNWKIVSGDRSRTTNERVVRANTYVVGAHIRIDVCLCACIIVGTRILQKTNMQRQKTHVVLLAGKKVNRSDTYRYPVKYFRA